MKKIFLLVFVLSNLFAAAQDSSRLRISLLTCTPGDELYSLFGHSALRVIDSNAVTDHVYNYGTFNFDDKGFYMKFVRGKLLYYMSIVSFEEFKWDYQSTNRGMTEQVLNLSGEEKQQLKSFLIENLKEENKYYQYDFFFDNCTTRLRDLIIKFKQPTPQLPAVRPTTMRFRQAIHEYLDRGKQPWSKLGIDILLGAKTDGVMKPAEQQFLPDNLLMAIDSNQNGQLVVSTQSLYKLEPATDNQNWFTPMLFFVGLLLLFVVLQFTIARKLPLLMAGLDGMLFFLTGLLGVILIFMWFATDHSMTKNNYNLLWALPSHIIISFFISNRKDWVKKYFKFSFFFGALVLVAWSFLPQQMNPALVPFVLLLMFRSWIRK